MLKLNIEERKDIILSRIEYKKKQRYLDNDPKFQNQIEIIDKIINNESINDSEFNIFVSQLEYRFKKILLDKLNSDIIDNRKFEELKNKADKAIYILKNLKIN